MIRIDLTGVVLAVCALGAAGIAEAQPVVEVQAGMQAPVAPPPPQVMRYILASGAIVIGSEVGGDAEWVMIQTGTGVVQIRRAEIASMDYQVGQGTVAVVAPQPQPQPYGQYASPPPRRRGRGLLIAGSIVFGISYGMPALIALTVSQESPSALWFLLPVAGPLLWAGNTCSDEGVWEDGCRALATTFAAFISLVQAAGMVMLIVGMSMRASSDDGQVADDGPRLAHGLELTPVVTPGYQGLALRSAF